MITPLQTALSARGYTDLTPVQTAVTDPALVGADLLVSAQTGSGKTVGFGLALGPTLLGDAPQFGPAGAPLALVIAPTRELALQVKRELGWLYAETGAIMASCVGGMDMRDERRALARGAHIVVATPGRLRDHIMRGTIDLGTIRGVVLDEADEMLDLGFREDLEFILGECPEDRRTLMFSATVPAAIATLAKRYQRDAQRITTQTGQSQHADIAYQAVTVANLDAENAIINVLRFHEAPNAIVFCNTRAMVNRITTRLSNRGFPVVALSGELTQSERTNALQAMRDGRARVCVATDVAARGIDLPNLDLVVHAELPSNHETLLHRSGRTGRAGRKGTSVLIVTPKVRSKATRILRGARLEADWTDAPSADDVRGRDEARLLSDPMWSDPVTEDEADMVTKLADAFSPRQLAAAVLRMQGVRHSAPEDLSPVTSDSAPKARAAFGPSVWFSVGAGRAQGVEVRRLLPTLCNAGAITRDDIGAIRIQQDTSYVEILASSADGFVKALGDMTLDDGATVARLEGVPEAASQPRPKPGSKPPSARPGPARGFPAAPSAGKRGDAASTGRNGVSAPHKRKPRADATAPSKPRGRKPPSRMDKAIRDGAVTPGRKPRHKSATGGKPGVAPKVGKPNSKKNKARRAAAQGGAQPPRRKG